MHYLAHFVTLFQQAFLDVMDTISNALLWSPDDISSIFSPVQHEITDIAWRARSAGRELVLGVRTGLVSVAKAVGVELPAWKPVLIPLYQNSAPAGAAAPGLYLL